MFSVKLETKKSSKGIEYTALVIYYNDVQYKPVFLSALEVQLLNQLQNNSKK
jgi:hypothetical protein